MKVDRPGSGYQWNYHFFNNPVFKLYTGHQENYNYYLTNCNGVRQCFALNTHFELAAGFCQE